FTSMSEPARPVRAFDVTSVTAESGSALVMLNRSTTLSPASISLSSIRKYPDPRSAATSVRPLTISCVIVLMHGGGSSCTQFMAAADSAGGRGGQPRPSASGGLIGNRNALVPGWTDSVTGSGDGHIMGQ